MFTHGLLAGTPSTRQMKPGCRVTHSRVKPAEVMTWSAGVLAPDGAQAETTPPPALPKSITTDTPDEEEHAAAPAGAEAPTSAAVVAVIAMMTATRRRAHLVRVSVEVTCCATRTS